MRRLRSRLTYANVMSTIAVFLALTGGTAFALSGSNTVFSDDITDNQVRSSDVRNDTLTGGGLASPDIRPNALRGSDINESSLERVPRAANADNAGTLDGKDSTELGVRAHALVDTAICPGNFCPLDRNRNVAYAVRVGNGRYCVGVNGIDASAPNSLALVGAAEFSRDQTVVWRKNNLGCVAREFEVETEIQAEFDARRADGSVGKATTPGNPENDVRFAIAVP